jgi:TRAP-type C4-dicarboxylate transport system substrate-binding protein
MYFSTELPLATVNTCMISTFKNDPVLTSRAWMKLGKEFPQIPAEWEAYDQKLLMGWEVGPYMWVSKKPIKTFEELNELKVGIWGGDGPRQLAVEMGSIPRSIASVEVYDALDKATIDARAESLPMVITYKHYEICDYITDVGIGTIGAPVYAMSINQKTWNSLPKEVQEQILQVTEDWWRYYEKRITEADANDRAFLKEKGVTIIEFSEEDKNKIRELPVFNTFRDEYIKRVKDQNLAAKIFDRYRELIK